MAAQEKYNATFPTRLRELIASRGTTITALAHELKISRQAVSQYQDGSTQPNLQKLVEISRYFNVSADWLLGLTDTQNIDSTARAAVEYTKLSERTINLLHSNSLFGYCFRSFVDLLANQDSTISLADAILRFNDKAAEATHEFKSILEGHDFDLDKSPGKLDEDISYRRYQASEAFTYMLDELLLRLNYKELLEATRKDLLGDDYDNDDISLNSIICARLEQIRQGKEAHDNG